MHKQIGAVADFHKKMDVSHAQDMRPDMLVSLVSIGRNMLITSSSLEPLVKGPDKRFLRSHLLIEELAELLISMGEGDQVGTLDAMADLLYVLLGAAITFDMPIVDAFDEVHRSNMTKEKQESDPSKDRVRVKGPNYVPPDIKGVLERWRKQ